MENGQEVFSRDEYDNPDTYVSSSRSLLLIYTNNGSSPYSIHSGFNLTITGN